MTADGNPRIWIVGVDWMGDVIFSTPVIRALRKHHPRAFIACSTASRCAEVLLGNPYLDAVLPYDERGFFGTGDFRRELRGHRFDTAVFLHRSATRAFLALRAGVRRRVGYPTWKRGWMLTHRAEPPAEGSHRADRYLGTLAPLGVRPDGREVDFFVVPEARRAFEAIKAGTALGDGRPYAVLHPGANWDLKRWPVAHFVELAAYFEERGFGVAVCGSAGESALADRIIASSRRGNIFSFCGKTSVQTLGALIEGSAVLVSNDSGPLHIAAGLGVPLVGLFGPTSAAVTGPRSRGPARVLERRVGCEVPCYFSSCHHRVCMDRLEPAAVIRELEDFFTQLERAAA